MDKHVASYHTVATFVTAAGDVLTSGAFLSDDAWTDIYDIYIYIYIHGATFIILQFQSSSIRGLSVTAGFQYTEFNI